MRSRALTITTAALAALAGLTACGNDTSSGEGIAITAGDSSCEVAQTELAAGPVSFTVTNTGNQITEVYLYGEQDGQFSQIVAEVENVGPGTSRELSATVTAGNYEIACKPGQVGDGIRTPITVTGETGQTQSEAGYDREIEIEATPTGVDGLAGLSATTGQRIEFKLENTAAATRELEIIDPSGVEVAAIEAGAGKTEETVVELPAPGDWTLKVDGDGIDEVEQTLTVTS